MISTIKIKTVTQKVAQIGTEDGLKNFVVAGLEVHFTDGSSEKFMRSEMTAVQRLLKHATFEDAD